MGSAVTIHYVTKYNGAHISKFAVFGATGPSWKQREGYPYGITDQGAADAYQADQNQPAAIGSRFWKGFCRSGRRTFARNRSNGWKASTWMHHLTPPPRPSPHCVTWICVLCLSKIKMPVAIFHGVNDKLCDFAQAEQLNKAIKGSYIVKFEKGGHGLFLEEMDKFNSELEKFARN
jgi:non-heme chloroperoxidase